MEDKCPFCGSKNMKPGEAPHYECETWFGNGILHRGDDCYNAQLQAQAARLEEAEKAKDYLTRLFQSCALQCIPEDNLLYLCA